MHKVITITIFFSVLYSCTFYRNTSDYKSESEFYESINRQSMDREAHIAFKNDSVHIGSNFIIGPDSSHWIDTNRGKNISHSNANISDITFEHPVRGMVNGLMIGGAAAMLIAAPVLASNKDKFEDKVAPIFVLAGFGLIGSITGAIIGYNISDKHVYELNQNK
jgi:hypothetical protein